MKKISRMLAALALCLVIVALPMHAMAEPMSMLSIAISDPVVLANGEAFLDMSGLELDLTGGTTLDLSKSTVQLQVLGGNDTALAALAEIADGKVVLTADGLNSKYALSMDSLAGMGGMGSMGGVNIEMVQALSQAAASLMNGNLPNELAVPINDFATELMGTMQDEGTVTYKMLSGEMEMQHMTMQASPELTEKLVNDVTSVLDNSAEFHEFLKAVAEASGDASALDNISIQELVAEAGMSQSMDIDLYSSTQTNATAVEMVQAISTADSDMASELHYKVLIEQPDYGTMNVYADVDVYSDDAPVAGFYFALQQAADTVNAEIGGGEYYGGEFESEFMMKAAASPASVNGVNTTEVRVEVQSEGETVVFTSTGYMDGGKLFGQFTVEADGMTVTASFDGQANQDGSLSGKLALSAENPEAGMSYGLQADTLISYIDADSSEVIIGADGAIDISTMSYEDQEAISNDLGALLINAVSVLDRNVPGLSGILTQMIGSMTY